MEHATECYFEVFSLILLTYFKKRTNIQIVFNLQLNVSIVS